MTGRVTLSARPLERRDFSQNKVELEVLRATKNHLTRDLFRFSDRLGPSQAAESQFAKF